MWLLKTRGSCKHRLALQLLPTLAGTTHAQRTVASADDFSYHDPIDGSTSARQGLRICFADGSRIIYRLSGTGTSGATVRIYVESYEAGPRNLDHEVQDALKPLVAAALTLCELKARTGRDRPTVIT